MRDFLTFLSCIAIAALAFAVGAPLFVWLMRSTAQALGVAPIG